MDIFDINYALSHITILVDTREQDTPQARKRLESMYFPYERKKLDFGDYSAKCLLPDNTEIDFSDKFAIERKMSIDELANCFCSGRKRFTKEFERAKQANSKLYLLVENATWENIYNGCYRSQMNQKALIASIFAWLARYNCQIITCKSETSSKLISDILYREIKEHFQNLLIYEEK